MMRPGGRNLVTEVPGVLVGNATDARLKSGVTVLTSHAPFVAGVDIRGGAPGTRETARAPRTGMRCPARSSGSNRTAGSPRTTRSATRPCTATVTATRRADISSGLGAA